MNLYYINLCYGGNDVPNIRLNGGIVFKTRRGTEMTAKKKNRCQKMNLGASKEKFASL